MVGTGVWVVRLPNWEEDGVGAWPVPLRADLGELCLCRGGGGTEHRARGALGGELAGQGVRTGRWQGW